MVIDSAAAVVLLFFTLPTSLLGALAVGCKAANLARSGTAEPARALWMLAFNMLEAPVNALLVPILALSVYTPGAAFQLWPTLPMLVLFLPALGLTFRETACRQVAWALLGLGGLRWLITIAIYLTEGDLALVGLGTLALWGSIVWGWIMLSRLSRIRQPAPEPSAQGWLARVAGAAARCSRLFGHFS